jgi:hypothetical protein
MSVKKVDLDQQGVAYASYVIAGNYIFTSICTGGATLWRNMWSTRLSGCKGICGMQGQP